MTLESLDKPRYLPGLFYVLPLLIGYGIVIFILSKHEHDLKYPIALILAVMTTAPLFSQDPEWHEGSVVLTTREVLKGKINLHELYDVVTLNNGDDMKVFPANRIHSVYFYDAKANINRKFTSIQHSSHGAFSSYQIFEVVLSGEIRVLRRLKSNLSDPSDDASGYHYYYQIRHEIVALHKFKSKAFPIMVRTCESLLPYVEQNKLNPTFSADVIRIIDFYNKTQALDNSLASNL